MIAGVLALANGAISALALWAFASIYATQSGMHSSWLLPIPQQIDATGITFGWNLPIYAALALVGLASSVGILAKRMWGLYLFVIAISLSMGLEAQAAYQNQDWLAFTWMVLPALCLYFMLRPKVRQALK